MEGVRVIDNCIPIEIQDTLEDLILNSNIKYGLQKLSTYSLDPSLNQKYQDSDQLVNLFIDEGKFIVDDMSHFFLFPLYTVCLKEKLNVNLEQIFRAKINIKFQKYSKLNTFINPPHRDIVEIDEQSFKLLILIYYINDSDGDTIIYKGNNFDNLEIAKTISPKKGRMIIMDGNLYHSASHPLKTDKRMVINYNLLL